MPNIRNDFMYRVVRLELAEHRESLIPSIKDQIIKAVTKHRFGQEERAIVLAVADSGLGHLLQEHVYSRGDFYVKRILWRK